MYIEETPSISKAGKKYISILLRESYRESGKVKKRTIANLSDRSSQEISAIKLALKYKDNLELLGAVTESIQLEQGLSVGAVWCVYKIAERLGIEKVFGKGHQGRLALWQIIARVIEQGSRLSAVRMAQTHAACEILNIQRGFDENDLYDNLAWLSDNQEKIEKGLFKETRGEKKPELFLYDVTSSYLEGQKNFFANWGYQRDGKRGKKQIVIGLLCDEVGDPVSIEVFSGNTQDPKTFFLQVGKVAQRFGVQQVTFVGDRGMIKSPQIEALPEGFHYITAITKPQIESLVKKGVIQLGLFEDVVCEVEDKGIRYVLRRNPYRAQEIQQTRLSKKEKIENIVKEKNEYLTQHPRAKVSTALKEINERLRRFKMDNWLKIEVHDRTLEIRIDEEVLQQASFLDGCYVIKTDLPKTSADKQIIHDRYKDLAFVEKSFRTCKTAHLELRPVYVRSEKSTQGHVFVIMMAYKIVRALSSAWEEFDLTVEEGLRQLSTLCATEVRIKNHEPCLKIPKPRNQSQQLLETLNIHLPSALPKRKINVVSRKNLVDRRKKHKNQ